MVGLLIAAGLDEWSQQWVGRIVDSWDMVANGLGVVLGALVVGGIWALLKAVKRLKSASPS